MYITYGSNCMCNASYIKDNPYLGNVVYPCDELIAPIIRLLNLRGYPTIACCSGHWTNGNVENYTDAVNGKEPPIIKSCKPQLEIPYIAFESGFHPAITELPVGWYWEIDHFYQLPRVCKVFERIVYENGIPIRKFSQYWETNDGRVHDWNYAIRANMDVFNVRDHDEYGNPIAYDNPYSFYETLVKHLIDLYQWVEQYVK